MIYFYSIYNSMDSILSSAKYSVELYDTSNIGPTKSKFFYYDYIRLVKRDLTKINPMICKKIIFMNSGYI